MLRNVEDVKVPVPGGWCPFGLIFRRWTGWYAKTELSVYMFKSKVHGMISEISVHQGSTMERMRKEQLSEEINSLGIDARAVKSSNK